MRTVRTILAAGVATLALVAVVALPAAAFADEPTGTVITTPTPPAVPVPTAHPGKRAIATYRTISRLRLRAFNADAAILRFHINRLVAVANRVAAKGGNVMQARVDLQTARADLKLAVAQATKAATDQRLVPYYVDRKAAQARADAEFKTARQTLRNARAEKAKAAVLLRQLVKIYKVKHVPAADFA